MATTKINAGIRFTLLSAPFVAAMQNDNEALQLLLVPSVPDVKKEITIEKMIGEIKSLMDGQGEESKELETQLKGAVDSMKDPKAKSFNPLSIGITIEEAFLYFKKTKGENPITTFEYAFSISLNTSQLMKEMEVFSLDGISLSIWNTERAGVIKQMKMLDVNDYLALCNA